MTTNTQARSRHRSHPHRKSSRARLEYLYFTCLLSGLLFSLCLRGLTIARSHRLSTPEFHTNDLGVVINEIAWGGTAASPFDEWIELLNLTGEPLSVEGWQLIASDGSPDIQLSGTIPARGYYVIERTDDATISDRPAELIASFGSGLSNEGEQLNLIDAFGNLVDTVNGNGGPWPNADTGASPTYQSLERVDPTAADLDGNWVSNDGSQTCGLDANGVALSATPGSINAAYYPRYSQHSDLEITADVPVAVEAGEIMTSYVELQNWGGLTATQVSVTATLPSGSYYYNQTNEHFTFNPLDDRTLVWRRADLDPHGARPGQITLTLSLSPSLMIGTVLEHHLLATTSSPELRYDNNIAVTTTTIRGASADLALSKTGPDQIGLLNPPDAITYSLNVLNHGPDIASGVWITDWLPGNLRLLTQTSPFSFTWNRTQLTWYVGELNPMIPYTITITTVGPPTQTESFTNHAGLWATTSDPRDDNNHAYWETHSAPSVLISSALYDGYAYMDADEAVGITNLGLSPVSLQGWSLCKDRSGSISCKALPAITVTKASEVWIARDTAAFAESFGFTPDAEATGWLGLTNSGDEVMLRDPDYRYVDALVYGDGVSTVPGWSGDSVTAYYNHLRGETGQIIHRIPDERTGLPAFDTDTARDWLQSPEDPHSGRRVLYPGWDMDALFVPLSVTETASTSLAVAPDHAFEFLIDRLQRAERSIVIEVYTLRHPALITTLAEKAADGVDVKVLLEGSPVGAGVNSPEWQTTLHASAEIETHGGEVWFMIHRPEDRIYNRYAYLHPKMIIIDGEWIVIGTQNLTASSLPPDDKRDGTAGTRGVLLATNAPSVVQRGLEIVALDLDPQHHSDLLRWNRGYSDTYGLPNPNAVDLSVPNWTSYTTQFTSPLRISGDMHFELFTAPEAALRQTDALLGLIERAGPGDRIDVEQTYEHMAWGDDPVTEPNLRLHAYLAAAHRGAQVRLLLNGHSFIPGFDQPPEENLETVAYIRKQAKIHDLTIQAAVGDPTDLGIHNKMVLVDLGEGGRYVHLGSINGSEGSNKINREVAIQLRSDEAHAYFSAVFDYDWRVSHPLYLPLMMRSYRSPRAADHLVISEVYYAGTAESEWVEIYNPTDDPVDLSSYRIGDAETPEAFEAMFHYPPGLSLGAGQLLVIAVNGSNVPEADLEFYDHLSTVPNMIRDPDWGDVRYPFALRNAGDQVVSLGTDANTTDIVLWGDAGYPDITPHAGVTNTAASLSRQPAFADTDDCALDFIETYPPTPGEIPGAYLRASGRSVSGLGR